MFFKYLYLRTAYSVRKVLSLCRRMQAQVNEGKALEATLCEQSQQSRKRHEKFQRQSEARWCYKCFVIDQSFNKEMV